jgi:8-oxo-dGTP pyrophosphatase MutT (NUDIX family)
MDGAVIALGAAGLVALAAHALSSRGSSSGVRVDSARPGSRVSPSGLPVVGAVTLVYDRWGRVLLLRRGPGAPWMPGRWGLPGGAIDAGETAADAAVREAWEEVALTLSSVSLLGIFEAPAEGWAMACYTAAPDQWMGKPRLQATHGIMEHDRMAWVDPRDLRGYDVIELVRKMIEESARRA